MKLKLGIAAAAIALAALQVIYSGQKSENAPAAGTAAQAQAPGPAPAAPSSPALPAPEDVTDISLGTGGGVSVTLGKMESGWVVHQLGLAAAPAEKVERLLAALLAGKFSPVPDGTPPGATGLAPRESVAVSLAAGNAAADAAATAFAIGLHPPGNFDATYVRLPGGETVLAAADLRAELGLWKNIPGETPEPGVWLDGRVLRFDPDEVVSLIATSPDHEIVFVKQGPADNAGDDAAHGWTLAAPASPPGGEWSEEGLRRWLEDLAGFRVSGVSGTVRNAAAPAGSGQEYGIALGFADGSEKTLRVTPGHTGESAEAAVSDFPLTAFTLPGWRFGMYFNRLASLFPKAAPRFAPEEVRLVDLRRNGESVKIARRGGSWEPPALAERAESLARLLASWRPEDYADAGPAGTGAGGGPLVELVLADGAVLQYRLSGRHPVFPWRYVTLGSGRAFSATDAEAEAMFPDFTE